MRIDFNYFKEKIQSKEVENFRLHSSILNQIESLYDEEDFKFFYAKNFFNEKDTELYIFLEEGYVHIQFNKKSNQYAQEILQFYSTPVSKKLILSVSRTEEIELQILYNTGEELRFNAVEDSNVHWADDYGKYIRQLYKAL